MVKSSFSKAEVYSEESPAPTEDDDLGEEAGSESDSHHAFSKNAEAQLGKEVIGDGSGSDVARPERAIGLDNMKTCENTENFFRKEANATSAFSEYSSSSPILVSVPGETPKTIIDYDYGSSGSRSIEENIVVSEGQRVPLVDKDVEDGSHTSVLGPCARVKSIGPFAVEKSGPISFDDECRKVGLNKHKGSNSKTRQKRRPIKILGERLVPSINPDIIPRNNEASFALEGENREVANGVVPLGSFVPCISHTDSEVMRCNNRLRSATVLETEVSRKVWNSIVKLGVVSGEEASRCIEKIEEMEKRDKSGLKGKMVTSNGAP